MQADVLRVKVIVPESAFLKTWIPRPWSPLLFFRMKGWLLAYLNYTFFSLSFVIFFFPSFLSSLVWTNLCQVRLALKSVRQSQRALDFSCMSVAHDDQCLGKISLARVHIHFKTTPS